MAPIPLYPCPAVSPQQAQGELPSDEYSDFPPIRCKSDSPNNNFHFRPRSSAVRKGPGPEQRSSPTQSVPPSQSPLARYSRRPNKGLGSKDILNTIDTELPLMRYPKKSNDSHKSTLKRGSEFCATHDSRPLKKYRRLTSIYKDDMDWIRDEIVDIKKCTREVAHRMEKVLARLERLS